MITATLLLLAGSLSGGTKTLAYAPSPPNNPLKGLVPYSGDWKNAFPHSMEFSYLPLKDLMKGPNQFDWSRLENLLEEVRSRGHQTVFRVFVEYPGQPNGVPDYLVKNGLKFIKYPDPDSNDKNAFRETPDYKNPDLQAAIVNFIRALGAKYDGDPRVAYITAGLLGCWGEWHNYPRDDLFASKALQSAVLNAYEAGFNKTPILLRYPRGKDDGTYIANANRKFGYHDDSFAWATLHTGNNDDSWYFMTALMNAGKPAIEKWMTQPIGGEIRPESWGIVFDPKPSNPKVQDFAECVRQTHATWLMDSGLTEGKHSPERIKRATQQVRKMGYDYTVDQVRLLRSGAGVSQFEVRIKNLGVAPFYANWPLEAVVWTDGKLSTKIAVKGTPRGILPESMRTYTFEIPKTGLGAKSKLLFRIKNPMENGLPVRFANQTQDLDAKGWLTLGFASEFTVGEKPRG